ncbi:hypothetical protein [Rosenbergiella epipactidis]|uniref:hypothetical protein n=1 Tax=Rosenbergiella epipactidis TaxID=1544694 RepID=UPI001F4EB5A7|nr:hypothetical protein [Rosenbergiella epipactidis]
MVITIFAMTQCSITSFSPLNNATADFTFSAQSSTFLTPFRPWKRTGTEQYHQLVSRCQQTLREVEPLRDLDADHPRISFTDPHQCLAEARKAK